MDQSMSWEGRKVGARPSNLDMGRKSSQVGQDFLCRRSQVFSSNEVISLSKVDFAKG